MNRQVRGQTEQFAGEREKKFSKDQWKNRLTPWGENGRFSERRTCIPAVRPERALPTSSPCAEETSQTQISVLPQKQTLYI